jgi:ferredoxin
MRVSVDRERCCGAGMCVLTVPEVFDQDEDDGRVVLLESAPPDGLRVRLHRAAGVCPSGAITVSGA